MMWTYSREVNGSQGLWSMEELNDDKSGASKQKTIG